MVKAVIVGEAWGAREARFQHPLVGPSGRELTLQMGFANFSPYLKMRCRKCKSEVDFIKPECPNCREFLWPYETQLIDHWKRLRNEHEILVTNVFNAQPPGNDLGYFFGTEPETPMPAWRAGVKPRGSHVQRIHFHHIQRLWQEIADARPNLVIALGNAACWALLGQTKITALRGTVNWTNTALTGLDLKVLPTFHPANVLRPTGRAMRPTVIADWQKATREVQYAEIRRPDRFITIPAPTPDGLDEIRSWISRPNIWRLSNDIETIRGQISIVGFADVPSNALVVPFRDAHSKDGRIIDVGKIAKSIGFDGGINYWPTRELEIAAWNLVARALHSPAEKVYQNGLYDLSYLIRMGLIPKNVKHDTMLWHHATYPEQPKSLGYLGSIYADDIAWKQMSRQDSLKRDE